MFPFDVMTHLMVIFICSILAGHHQIKHIRIEPLITLHDTKPTNMLLKDMYVLPIKSSLIKISERETELQFHTH